MPKGVFERTEIHKKRISRALRKKWKTQEHYLKGRKRSEETRRKISESHMGIGKGIRRTKYITRGVKTKVCTMCRKRKSVDLDFMTRVDAGYRYYRTRCNACEAIKRKERRDRNIETARAYERDYRMRNPVRKGIVRSEKKKVTDPV